jgi:hypothetical protein
MTLTDEILINLENKTADILRLKIKAAFFWDMTPWILANS